MEYLISGAIVKDGKMTAKLVFLQGHLRQKFTRIFKK
jgi:hypothetical protein